MTSASVELWGKQIGAVSWLEDRGIGVFQFTPAFAQSGIEVSPLMMPLRNEPYQFPELSKQTFKGLPGMLADSLPDKFGNAVINTWLAQQYRTPESFNPVERLCYTGTRGMGALEFKPALKAAPTAGRKIVVDRLVALSNRILDQRDQLQGKFDIEAEDNVIEEILRVGTSAGGARAKAILAWNESTGEFRSGQVQAEKGYSHWLMKFDGVGANSDKEVADPLGFGRIEYAYYLMARQAGIVMMPSRLHEEGGRAHFMTKRFDRTDSGAKLHYHSLGGLMHFDFNRAGDYSYEQALQVIRQLRLPAQDVDQQVRRVFFNVLARNQDDHVKNIGFLMNPTGEWRLAPAFDVAYGYNAEGAWTSRHQMSLHRKRDGFVAADLIALAKAGGIKAPKAKQLIEEIGVAVRNWREHAATAAVTAEHTGAIERTLRIQSLLAA